MTPVMNMSDPFTANWDKLKVVICMERDMDSPWTLWIGTCVSCNGRSPSFQKTGLASLDCDY